MSLRYIDSQNECAASCMAGKIIAAMIEAPLYLARLVNVGPNAKPKRGRSLSRGIRRRQQHSILRLGRDQSRLHQHSDGPEREHSLELI